MSFDIHGFEPLQSSDPTAGLLILRFAQPTSTERLNELARELANADVLPTEAQPRGGGTLAALRWRVPTESEVDGQRTALTSSGTDVAEAWAFVQSAETDLSDWFAPKWRNGPPARASAEFKSPAPPDPVSWEGFGVELTFSRTLEASDRDVIRAIAELWLSAYSDNSSQGSLGSQCYKRAVIARAGNDGVVVGLEGLAKPGSDTEITGHMLWFAETVGRVLPVANVRFVGLLPQATESGEPIAPAKVLERATNEWQSELAPTMTGDDLPDGEPPEMVPEPDHVDVTVRTTAVEDVGSDLDDDSWAIETTHLPRADEAINEAIAAREAAEAAKREATSNGVSAHIEIGEATTDEEPTLDVSAIGLDDEELELPAESGDESGTEQIIAALQAGDLAAALSAFDASSDKSAGAEILLDVIEDLDASDWDDLQPILKLSERIVAAKPERSSGHLQRINALCRLGRGDEAIGFGLAEIDRDDVLYETFERLCVFRRVEESESLLGRLAEHSHVGIGNHYYNLGCKLHPKQPAIAIALYRGAIACGSPRPQADINMGLALISERRYERAAELTTAALEQCGDEPNLWANLIDVQTRLRSPELSTSIERARATLAQCSDIHEAKSPASCSAGCAALISDITLALLQQGKATEVVSLIEEMSGENDVVPRVRFSHARALAITGEHDAAIAILDGVETSQATSAAYYSARANVVFLAGKQDAAVGLACAAIHADAASSDQFKFEPIGEAVANLGVSEDGEPPRPPSVPEDAAWNASDGEWELGDRDDDGEKHGPYRYYRVDGTLCNECTLVHGKPHGEFFRYHESGAVSQTGAFKDGQLHGTRTWQASPLTTSEIMHNDQISTRIRRSEMDYVNGRVVAIRHYDAAGTVCDPSGEPYPDRPGEVADDAFFKAEEEEWVRGEVDDGGQRRGVWRRWNTDGVLLEESEYEGGARHGGYKAFFADGSLSAEGQYVEGEKSATFVYQRRGDEEHEDFPIAVSSVVVAEESHDTDIASVRLYDKTGREVAIDGIPLEDWTTINGPLKAWFHDLWQVPWPELEDASGNAHRVPQLMLGVLAEDEDVNAFVFRALYWHLSNDGQVYPATAAAVPFLVRLAQGPNTRHLARLCNLIRHLGCHSADALAEAQKQGNHALLSTSEALQKRIDAFLDLLGHADPEVRAVAGATLSGASGRDGEMSSHISGALANEESEMVRASHMFSLARFDAAEALFVVEAQLVGGSPLVAAAAAMALVMARGQEAGERVGEQLVSSLVNYSDEMGEAYAQSPWSDEHLVTEMTQALHYYCEGNSALTRLAEAFPQIKTSDGTAAVAAALMIASASGDGLTDDVRATLSAIADCDGLWALGNAIIELLDGYELPTNPDELRALAQQ